MVGGLLRRHFSAYNHLSLGGNRRGSDVSDRRDARKSLPNVALVDLGYDRDHFHGTRTPRPRPPRNHRRDYSARLATRFTSFRSVVTFFFEISFDVQKLEIRIFSRLHSGLGVYHLLLDRGVKLVSSTGTKL